MGKREVVTEQPRYIKLNARDICASSTASRV